MQLLPKTLSGKRVTLEVLSPGHKEALIDAALSAPAVFRYMPYAMATRTDARLSFEFALRNLEAGTWLPFVTRDRVSGALAGATSLFLTDAAHRRLEIGGTWILPPFQRTHVNSEAKYLQLRYAFEECRALRVELKTDSRNLVSQRAMERLGAVREGTLRSHMLCHDGYVRDSVYYSIVASEWPELRRSLEARISAPGVLERHSQAAGVGAQRAVCPEDG